MSACTLPHHPTLSKAKLEAVAKRARTKRRYEAKLCDCGGWRVVRKRTRRVKARAA